MKNKPKEIKSTSVFLLCILTFSRNFVFFFSTLNWCNEIVLSTSDIRLMTLMLRASECWREDIGQKTTSVWKFPMLHMKKPHILSGQYFAGQKTLVLSTKISEVKRKRSCDLSRGSVLWYFKRKKNMKPAAKNRETNTNIDLISFIFFRS